MYKLAVLGCGNMGQAIIRGMPKEKKQFEFYLYDPESSRAQDLAGAVGGTTVQKLSVLPPCDFYLVACKPQNFGDLAVGLNPVMADKAVVISIMAGVAIAKMQTLLPRVKQFVRVMPNTPCLVGAGVCGIYFTAGIDPQMRTVVEEIFTPIAKVITLESEDLVDVTTAATGSGPAYIFAMASHMIRKTEAMGIPHRDADIMIKQLFVGASRLMAESPDTPEELRRKVTSKGGTTEAALRTLEEGVWGPTLENALESAYRRAKELAK